MAPLPPLDQVTSLVEDDTVACFQGVFPPTEGFAIAEPFTPTEGDVSNGRLGALAWTWSGQDTVGFNGMGPTGQDIVVRGVTVVEVRGEDDLLYHRYIDWTGVAGQLGLGFIGRTSVPEYIKYDRDFS
jgi:hypothetical protein